LAATLSLTALAQKITESFETTCEIKAMRLRFRYSLRSFLLLISILAIWLGLHVTRAQRQQAAVNAVNDIGGAVYYQYQVRRTGDKISLPAGGRVNEDGTKLSWGPGVITVVDEQRSYLLDKIAPKSPPVPTWIRGRIGDDMFVNVIAVHLEDTELTDRNLSFLAGLPYLRVLDLSRTDITDEGLAQLSRLKRLEKLTLDETAIDGVGLAHLKRLPRLEELSLAGSAITDAGLQSTLAPTTLKSITLDDTGISDAALVYLGSADRLATVSLSGTSVRGTGLRRLDGAEVQTLRLASTPIEDAGLLVLTRWPKLRSLSLEHSSLTDPGLENLKHLSSLKELRLPWAGHRSTSISVEAARAIEKALPNTTVTYPP